MLTSGDMTRTDKLHTDSIKARDAVSFFPCTVGSITVLPSCAANHHNVRSCSY